ncbi:cupin domain-containing protein [Luminiphilus sp.]|jgi:mannose-6-phosphate isomerase-like protein (cupin superfamily)|nr:cupin domain-containing protein [Luminiphilus sp.]MDB2667595.1 cupin domain-containing protein [Luminiphilus sp.]MDC0507622.1 cupin domain-containing protein [Luminiphilus sp.]
MNRQIPLPVNFTEKFAVFNDQWAPKIIAQMNDYQFKLVRLQGEFVWHEHTDTDETFIVLEGSLVIDFKEGSVTLNAGEMVVVPKGCLHRPRADTEAKLLLVEPVGVVNTGDTQSALTAPLDDWL